MIIISVEDTESTENVDGLEGSEGQIEIHFIDEVLPGYFWLFPVKEGVVNVGIGMLISEQRKQKGMKKSSRKSRNGLLKSTLALVGGSRMQNWLKDQKKRAGNFHLVHLGKRPHLSSLGEGNGWRHDSWRCDESSRPIQRGGHW